MIPTLILLGILLGRWWRSALVAACLYWPALLWIQGVVTRPGEIAGAALFALVNSAIGVGVHQLALRFIRSSRDHVGRSAPADR